MEEFTFVASQKAIILAGITALSLLVPLIAVSYILFRLWFRLDDLRSFFAHPGVRRAYLTSRGFFSHGTNEEELEANFTEVFTKQRHREFGRYRFTFGIIVGSLASASVVYFLAWKTFLNITGGSANPTPTDFALLGAFVWTVWHLLASYESLDLQPSSFYWIPFRYLVAIPIGEFASVVFSLNGIAQAFALVSAAIPYPQLITFISDFVPQLRGGVSETQSLTALQGIHSKTVERLNAIGINTPQELAYADPLRLLFRTNLPPKVLLDLMDQALLYNYVGEGIENLRRRGIRGAIELYAREKDSDLDRDLASALGVTTNELTHFTHMLGYDHQVRLVNEIWDCFYVAENEERGSESDESGENE